MRPLLAASAVPLALSLLFARPATATEPARVAFPQPAHVRLWTPEAPPEPKTEAELWVDYGRGMEELGRMIAWAEIVIPDLRLEPILPLACNGMHARSENVKLLGRIVPAARVVDHGRGPERLARV